MILYNLYVQSIHIQYNTEEKLLRDAMYVMKQFHKVSQLQINAKIENLLKVEDKETVGQLFSKT